MRKLLFITAGFILAFGLISCEKQKTNPQGDQVGNDAITKGQPVVIEEPEMSTPVIIVNGDVEVAPYLIPGKNKGGNRTCAEAVEAFDDIPEFADKELGEFTDCGEKVDIDDGYFGEVEGFPFYVEVNDDGSVYFHTGSEECKVKVVIVKGSNSANVYYFPDGIMSADGLAAPAFDPAVPSRFPWVSNLTFCCFCDEEEEDDNFYASKLWYLDETGEERWAITYGSGTGYFSGSGEWCDYVEFGDYPSEDMDLVDKIIKGSGGNTITSVGSMTVDASGNIDITLTSADHSLTRAYLYFGDMTDLGTANLCADYANDWIPLTGLSGQTAEYINGVDFNIPTP